MAGDSERTWEDNGGGGRARRPQFSPSVGVYVHVVDKQWISTLPQFFVTLGYGGRTVERVSDKKRTVFTSAPPVVSAERTSGAINASSEEKTEREW